MSKSVQAKDESIDSPFPLTAIDKFNLTQTDDQMQRHSWEELKQLVAENKLEAFRRIPSDLRRYMRWSSEVKSAYGSVPNYVMRKRLNWTPSARTTPDTGPLFDYESPIPFQNPNDYKILPNDWPYGLESGISHLIVWLRNRLEQEPERGDMTPNARTQVEEFIQEKFVKRVKDLPGPEDKVIWFKNWTALQSVPGMDHIHVLVRSVPPEIIDEWTGGEKIVQ